MGQLSTESKWTLWTNGERECFERLSQDMTRWVHSLQMPAEGVSQVVGELGKQFEARYTQACLNNMPPEPDTEPEVGRESAKEDLVPGSNTASDCEQPHETDRDAELEPVLVPGSAMAGEPEPD